MRRLVLLGVVWLAPGPAQADALPEPAVPEGWERRPPPQPVAPPDKELPALGLAMIMLAAGVRALRRGPRVAHG